LHGPQPPFDVPVVGFDAVIRVAPGSMATATMQLAVALQFPNSGWVASQSVSSEHIWSAVVWIGQSSLQETFGGFSITGFR
jgi:hypothetical protein